MLTIRLLASFEPGLGVCINMLDGFWPCLGKRPFETDDFFRLWFYFPHGQNMVQLLHVLLIACTCCAKELGIFGAAHRFG